MFFLNHLLNKHDLILTACIVLKIDKYQNFVCSSIFSVIDNETLFLSKLSNGWIQSMSQSAVSSVQVSWENIIFILMTWLECLTSKNFQKMKILISFESYVLQNYLLGLFQRSLYGQLFVEALQKKAEFPIRWFPLSKSHFSQRAAIFLKFWLNYWPIQHFWPTGDWKYHSPLLLLILVNKTLEHLVRQHIPLSIIGIDTSREYESENEYFRPILIKLSRLAWPTLGNVST